MVKRFNAFLLEVIHGPTDFKNERNPVTRIWGETEAEMNHKALPSISHMDQEHIGAVRAYAAYSSSLNRGLHDAHERFGNISYNQTGNPHDDKLIPYLDHVTKSYEAPHDFHVYTGLEHPPLTKESSIKEPSVEQSHIKGVLPAYTSTSLSPNVAKAFSDPKGNIGHLLKIHIPKGSKHGAYIAKNLLGMDRHHEREFLIKRGTKIHIHPVPEMINHKNTSVRTPWNTETHIWHAHIVE